MKLFQKLLAILLIAFSAGTSAAEEVYYDQFDWGFLTGSPGDLNTDFWSGPREQFSYEPNLEFGESRGSARLSNSPFFSQLSTGALGISDLEFYAHIRMSDFLDTPGERNAEIAFRSNGTDGYLLTLDGGQDIIRLRRQGGGYADIVMPAAHSIQPGDDFYVAVRVEGDNPTTITARVATAPDFAPGDLLFDVEAGVTNWNPDGDSIRLIGFTTAGSYDFDFNYFAVGEPGFPHPESAFSRSLYTNAPPEPTINQLGDLVSYDVATTNVVLQSTIAALRVVPRLDKTVRVDFAPDGDFSELRESVAVTRTNWPAPDFDVIDEAGQPIRIFGDEWQIEVRRSPITLRFLDGEGNLLTEEKDGLSITSIDDRNTITFALDNFEGIYGLGEPSIHANVPLDRRGHTFNTQNLHEPPSKLIFPFWVSSRGYGVFIDNPGFANIDIGESFFDQLTYQSDIGDLQYYVYFGDDMYDVLDQHTQLTGRPALAPRWTLGNVQSRFGYESFDEIQGIIDGFRSRQIPLDGIIIDLYWFGIENMGNLEFQQTPNWANPVARLDGFRQQGIKTIPITEPHVTGHSFNLPELEAQGLLGQHPDGGAYGFNLWWVTNSALTYLIDFTNPATREWWKDKHQKLIEDYAFDGFWQDLNEPEAQPADMIYHTGPAPLAGNTIAINMNRALVEAMDEYRPGARTFIMSRSGYVGTQKYGASVWSGDVSASWTHLSRQPALAVSMGLAGVPYWNSDIGGFNGTPSPELYLRWCQFGLFNPLYRPHAAHDPREPWAFGSNVEEAVRDLLRLRYRLIPHYYTINRETFDTGAPIMRPLVMEFPNDPNVANMALPFLYGKDLLARPVVQPGVSDVDIYFPEGRWLDWFRGDIIEGPALENYPVTSTDIPLFQREGSIIPLGPVMETSDEAPLTSLTLSVFPGANGMAAGELYEDDGLTQDYETGDFARTQFTAHRTGQRTTVNITPTQGSFTEIPATRSWEIHLFDTREIDEVNIDGSALPEIPENDFASGIDGWYYDEIARTAFARSSNVTSNNGAQFEFLHALEPQDVWLMY